MALMFAMPTNVAEAENTSVVIDLNSSSKFAAYNDVFAYTYNTSLFIVKDDKISSYPNAFTGDCIGLEINRSNILVLTQNGTQTSLSYFDYDDHGIKSASSKLGTMDMKITNLLSDASGNFFFYATITGTSYYIKQFKEATNAQAMPPKAYIAKEAHDTAFTEFLYYEDSSSLYAIKNGNIYVASVGLLIEEYQKVTSISDAHSLSMSSNEIFVNAASGIYKLDPATNTETRLCQTNNGTGEIYYTNFNSKDYIFVCEGDAVVQYTYDGSSCTYYNKFNNSKYEHPTSFDIVQVAKLTAESANIYSSPRNMQINSTVSRGEFFLLLTTVTNEDSGSYYYIAKQDGTKGYIKSNTGFEKINANTDARTFKIGLYAQGLHASTNIYKYPYQGAEVLSTATIFDELVVINNVAELDGIHVWDYYKVSLVQDGQIVTGYVAVNDVSPYTSLRAPTVLKTVKISSGSIGSLVYLYALPSEESAQVAALTDGEELDLAEEYNKDSTWTKVVYGEKYAYVLTSQISQKGLTAVQITLIVISCVVFVASILMIIFMKKKRKIGF